MSISYEEVHLSQDFYLPKVFESAEVGIGSSDLGSIDVVRADSSEAAVSRTLVWAQPWSGYVARPDVTELNGLMAARLRHNVIGVDNVGIGLHTASMDSELGDEVAAGNLDGVATAQWQAIGETPESHEHIPTELTLLGYSLGASVAAAQAKELPESAELNRLILFEGVVSQVSLSRLMARFAFEATRLRSYSAQNPDWAVKRGKNFFPKGNLPRVSKAYWKYPKALAQAHIFEDLKEARDRENLTADTEVVIINGEKSKISHTPENDELARNVNAIGVQSVRRIVLIGEAHGVIDSAPKFIEALHKALI